MKKFKIKKLEKGDIFYDYNTHKNHILGFVDDGCDKIVVYKSWLKYKGYWGYYAKTLDCILYDISLSQDFSKEEKVQFFKLNDVYFTY